ncbi:MAG TPA: SCO family protein [Streptosporangiaceae bacterium]|nr:SCO family protein [Streptosporangiaceae bacterium]
MGTRKPAGRMLLRAGAAAGLLALAACGASTGSTGAAPGMDPMGGAQAQAAAANPDLDPGTSLGSRTAPDIRLENQFGQPMSLSQFRGKVVVLAFVDSECTTVCPLTTVSMVQARELLGAAGDQVQLLGVDANPSATSVHDVMAYSQAHAMVNQWDFLTGSLAQLRAVWQAYHIYVQIQAGQIDHTPALYVIDQQGREREIYLTTMAYASVGQEGQVLAQEVARLLPGHPKLARQGSLAYINGLGPASRATLSAAPSGTVTLGPGQPRLVMFFATWLSETSDLRGQLTALNAYAQAARRSGLPPLVAVDEAVSEPSASAAQAYLHQPGQPLDYPVALDTTGRLADGYGVQDQPWFVLTSAAGKVVWSHDGWLAVSALEAAARKA